MRVSEENNRQEYRHTKMQDVVWLLTEKTERGRIHWNLVPTTEHALFYCTIKDYKFTIGIVSFNNYFIAIRHDGTELPIDEKNDWVTYSSMKRLHETVQHP